jgi:hypothetical protein
MIRFLLLYKIEWTDQHPGLMAAGAALTIYAALALMQAMP